MREPPLVRLGNGVEVHSDVRCFFDPTEVGYTGIHCLSHAHYDHLPYRMKGRSIVCSEITMRCASFRLRREIKLDENDRIKMLNAGHIFGSTMFLLEGEQNVLYTGDLCTRDRTGMKGARPTKADVLILEATYGTERYVFPPVEDMEKSIRDWVDENLSAGRSVIIFSYPLGKSQELLMLLKDHYPYIFGTAAQTTAMIEAEGFAFNYREFDPYSAEEPFVLICPTGSRRSPFIERLRKNGAVTAAVSGWALDPSYKYRMGVDETIPLSDHSDYNDLLEFADRCDPSLVLTFHGFDTDLARGIKENLDIDAYPLQEYSAPVRDSGH